MSMKLRNLKASFIFKQKVFGTSKMNTIVKVDNFTFTIYHYSTYLVNVTGVKSLEQLKFTQKIIEEKLQQQVVEVRIDNTFFSKKDYRNINMDSVYKFMKLNEDFHVDYNIELFAGMYFHPKLKDYPTILFFRTGSYTMMGGKSILCECECATFIKKLITVYDRSINKVNV
jgi:TATA-box binding protein (TBP) (component of TFIID and TFIIIB)